MARLERSGNELLLQALREQNRKTEILVEIGRQQQKAGALSQGASFLGGLKQSGVGGAVIGAGERIFGKAAPGASAAAAGGAIGAIADIVKSGIESGFRASASVFRSASAFQDRAVVEQEASRQFGQGVKEGLLNQVPIVGPEAAARSNLAFRSETERDFRIFASAKDRTINDLAPLARALGAAGQKIDPATVNQFFRLNKSEETGLDALIGFATAEESAERASFLNNLPKAQSNVSRGR